MPIGNEQNVALSENGVREIASALFGTRMHFADRSKLLVYFILDTTSMQRRIFIMAAGAPHRKSASVSGFYGSFKYAVSPPE